MRCHALDVLPANTPEFQLSPVLPAKKASINRTLELCSVCLVDTKASQDRVEQNIKMIEFVTKDF